jgi:hypothetical protein
MNIKLFFLVCLTFLFVACSKEDEKKEGIACDGSNLTYNSGIASIINASCNGSSCHGSGSQHGAFTTYAGLQAVISSGIFNNRVVVKQDMPQGSDLTTSQLNKIKCWVDNGYPEN